MYHSGSYFPCFTAGGDDAWHAVNEPSSLILYRVPGLTAVVESQRPDHLVLEIRNDNVLANGVPKLIEAVTGVYGCARYTRCKPQAAVNYLQQHSQLDNTSFQLNEVLVFIHPSLEPRSCQNNWDDDKGRSFVIADWHLRELPHVLSYTLFHPSILQYVDEHNSTKIH